MKTRFTSIDIKAAVAELQRKFLGMRVANCYDIDTRTYLIKLAKPDMKATILLESGNRIHSTEFEWPKNMSPSGFSMKLRKHLRTRRLESITQLGADRIVDLQFGSSEAAYHIILELYDRGNIVLTDFEYNILNILRPRTDNNQDVRFAVREKYPVELAKQAESQMDSEKLHAIFLAAKEGDNMKRILNPKLDYGPAVIEHVLLKAGFSSNARLGHEFITTRDMPSLLAGLEEARQLMVTASQDHCKGYIVQKQEKKAVQKEGEADTLLTYHEFHPMLYKQHENLPFLELDSFDKAVDEFFSKMESQKLDMKVLQQEKSALKKLENVKKDHEKRIDALKKDQDTDAMKGQLIEMNQTIVDSAIRVIQSALANQIDWSEIHQLVKEAQAQGDPVAQTIKGLRLEANHITLLLKDPYDYLNDDDDDDTSKTKPMKVDIDLSLTAYANARKYFDMKKHAAKKELKTVESSTKAMKSAERKTKQTLKDVAVAATINKARKTYWFEKFLWFISSENYIVVGGRDQQQNEFLVKRHLRPGDLYVHADLHGASSVIIKNPSGEEIAPKTMNEAGTMAVCNSAAWDAKVVTSAWWVRHDQVSKTAPTGEYLVTGSFMIRGKKNYLPPCYLIYGFGFLYKLDEDSIFRHQGERRVRSAEEDNMSVAESSTNESEVSELASELADDGESSGESSDEDEDKTHPLNAIREEGNNVENGEEDGAESCDHQHKSHDMKDSSVKIESAQTEEAEEESLFPDTTIELQHVKGDKFTLQRSLSAVSSGTNEEAADDELEEMKSETKAVKSGPRLSAKQRRELRKKAKQGNLPEDHTETDPVCAPNPAEHQGQLTTEGSHTQTPPHHKQEKSIEPQVQAKRGQKGKLKKMKEKYGDQDEEERQLRMEILAISLPDLQSKYSETCLEGPYIRVVALDRWSLVTGSAKEAKKKDKKKNKQKERQAQQKQQQQQQGVKGQLPKGPLTARDITVETPVISEQDLQAQQPDIKANEADGSDDEKQTILEEENIVGTEDVGILDSLTGLPVVEDTLLYAIPVCAPYSCMLNYKHKVKLTPGTTKRGKAAKTALSMFLFDKSSTPREKELLRVVKDTDLSRYMPGKVKVSAPNLHLHKNKKK